MLTNESTLENYSKDEELYVWKVVEFIDRKKLKDIK